MVLSIIPISCPRIAPFMSAIALVAIWCSSAFAQISPGDLHRAHLSLEGVENCTKCHGTDRELVSEKCLACHSTVKFGLDNQSGLHGKQNYRQCQLCHVEHQGRDFALIYWKEGRAKFNHALTGYLLDGKHTGLDCRKCHNAGMIADSSHLLADKMSIDSSFFGLNRNCATCHLDEHRGQITAACSTCHTTTGWKPPTGFDHSRSKYPLTGKHINILCAKCHLEVIDHRTPTDSSYIRLAPLKFQQCTDCHTDFHKGKLGDNCQNCHATEGWHLTDKAKFDHNKTRYPLVGRHFAMACDKCHSPAKKGKQLKYETCQACHSDFHKKEFAKREAKGACEECHSVYGFSPAKFLVSQHDQSNYPLRGAHRAVACIACHERSAKSDNPVFQFRFEKTQCLVCHKDPHNNEVKKQIDDKGCEFCHVVDSWRTISFDHALSKFPLEGKHKTVTCDKCHRRESNKKDAKILRLNGFKFDCGNCHDDFHRGQFAKGKPAITDCRECHTSENWKAPKFDHNAVSKFKLDGAHKNVPCALCHKPTVKDGKRFVAYKPLDTTCASCHGGITPVMKEKKS